MAKKKINIAPVTGKETPLTQDQARAEWEKISGQKAQNVDYNSSFNRDPKTNTSLGSGKSSSSSKTSSSSYTPSKSTSTPTSSASQALTPSSYSPSWNGLSKTDDFSMTNDAFAQKYMQQISGIAAYNNVDMSTAKAMFEANLDNGNGNYKGGGVATNWDEMVNDYRNIKDVARKDAESKGWSFDKELRSPQDNGYGGGTMMPGQQGIPQNPQQAQQMMESSVMQTGSVMETMQQIGREFAQQSAEHAAAVGAQYNQMVELLNQMENQLLGQIRQQMGGDDPGMQAAIGVIKQEAERMRDEALEDLNSRGLVQSGIYAEAVTRLRNGELSEIQQVVGQRFGDLQNQLNQAMMSMAQSRIGALSQYQGTMNSMMTADRNTLANIGMQGAQLGLEERGQNLQNTQFNQKLNQDYGLALMDNAMKKYGIDIGSADQRYGIDVGSADQRYGIDTQNKFNYYNVDQSLAMQKYGIDVNSADSRYAVNNRSSGGGGGGGYTPTDFSQMSPTELMLAGINPETMVPYKVEGSQNEQNLMYREQLNSQMSELTPKVQANVEAILSGQTNASNVIKDVNSFPGLLPEVREYVLRAYNEANKQVQNQIRDKQNTPVKRYTPPNLGGNWGMQ